MRKRLVCFLLAAAMLLAAPPAQAAEGDFIRWVDFNLTAEAMEHAIALEQRLREKEIPVSWLDILALGSVRSGGKRFSAKDAEKAAAELSKGVSPEELLGAQYRYFDYYRKTYEAALGGLVGCYAVETTDAETGEKSWKPVYGVKAFSPIAEGCWYAHYRDFGSSRSFGFQRRHLGNDLLGSLGTPIVAVEGGTVEALGWNRYGGWRVGIRSFDGKRYYYYAHMRQNRPYHPDVRRGAVVRAGDVIGAVGATALLEIGEQPHLHFAAYQNGQCIDPSVFVGK